MSMFDALKGMSDKFPFYHKPEVAPADKLSTVDSMAELVRMANEKGFIDPLSSTWSGVKGWAASELLETYVKGEKADDVKAVELKARSKVLRELMDIANPKKQKKFE